MIKVYISRSANDGILRVIEAMYEHLPKFGIQPTENIYESDIICNHGTMLDEVPGIPSVAISHGLYWSRQPWGDGFMDVNRDAVETLRHAVAWTAPSDWVNRAIRRGGFWYPETVYHGVDADKFTPSSTHEEYILWNKARADYVSNPNDLMTIAGVMPQRQFHTTIGHPDVNVRVLGTTTHQEMKDIVSKAGVYLATARETFGIGTLEALAYGVPVAGWDWGGTKEIIIPGITGYLAPYGDYRALAECIELCFEHRDILSRNAIQDVKERWKWEPRIEQYANIFKRVYKNYYRPSPKVSVIVTAYKLDKYLHDCLDSVQRQTFHDFECLIVDDAAQDSTKKIVEEYAQRDRRFSYNPTPNNFGLPGARNYGLARSNGRYIRHVDADDFLADNALELEATALDSDYGIDIAYGHLEVVREDGSRIMQGADPVRSGWPEAQFNWYRQMAHLNQLPSCVMARREVYERSGGYRDRMKRNEDAEFWCRVTSLGFRAKKFTQAVTYFHRERLDSKGAVEWASQGQEPDWTAWFPWRLGATEYRSATEIITRQGEQPRNRFLVPFGAQGDPPPNLRFWYIHDYAYPVVSIIVTVGPGHKGYMLDALDSIQAQNFPDWECIVVNDTGEKWGSDIMGAPWAKVVNMDGNCGASAARNEGYKHARGKYIVWMDADDYWMPWFLEKMVGYAEYNDGVIFSDIIMKEDENKFKTYTYKDFNSELVPNTMQYPGSSILYPRKIVDAMLMKHGGWDTEIPGMEDWNYQIAVHDLGFCAFHIPECLFVYRMYTSTKREKDYARIEEITSYMDMKWSEYRKGDKKLMCGCGQPKTPPSSLPASMLSSSGQFGRQAAQNIVDGKKADSMVTVEYSGPIQETFTIRSRVANSVSYRFGNNELHRANSVFLGDAIWMTAILNAQGNPVYTILASASAASENDPALFIGQPVN